MTTALSRTDWHWDHSVVTELIAWFLVLSHIAAYVLGNLSAALILGTASLSFVFAVKSSTLRLRDWLTNILAVTCLWSLAGHIVNQPLLALAWLGNINLAGYLAGILLLLSIQSGRASLVVIAGATMILSRSAGAQLSCLIALAYLCRSHKTIVILAVVACLAIMATNESISYISRLVVWRSILLGNHTLELNLNHAHSVLFEAIWFCGWYSLLLLVPLACAFVVMYLRYPAMRAALLWVSVGGLVDFIYWWPGVLAIVVAWLILASRDNVSALS